jgi:hypothetical protein
VRHEKESQEEIEGNVKNWNARKVRLIVRLPREKHKKKSGPLTRGRFVIVPSRHLVFRLDRVEI